MPMDAWLHLASMWDIIHLGFFQGISTFNQEYMLDRLCLHESHVKFSICYSRLESKVEEQCPCKFWVPIPPLSCTQYLFIVFLCKWISLYYVSPLCHRKIMARSNSLCRLWLNLHFDHIIKLHLGSCSVRMF